jgi:hypothetical protein
MWSHRNVLRVLNLLMLMPAWLLVLDKMFSLCQTPTPRKSLGLPLLQKLRRKQILLHSLLLS